MDSIYFDSIRTYVLNQLAVNAPSIILIIFALIMFAIFSNMILRNTPFFFDRVMMTLFFIALIVGIVGWSVSLLPTTSNTIAVDSGVSKVIMGGVNSNSGTVVLDDDSTFINVTIVKSQEDTIKPKLFKYENNYILVIGSNEMQSDANVKWIYTGQSSCCADNSHKNNHYGL